MIREAYCPNCGWRKVGAGLKAATAHNRSCKAQRADWKPILPKQEEIAEEDFEWYPGWEKHWERIERRGVRDGSDK